MAAETIVITSPTAQAYAELQAAFDHYNRELLISDSFRENGN